MKRKLMANRLNQLAHHLQPTTTPTLVGKVCIVTGAGSDHGIGRATVHALVACGARAIYATDITDNVQSLAAYSNTVTTVIPRLVDAADEVQVKGIAQDALRTYGRLDVFFANAGIARHDTLQDSTAEEFMDMLRVNTLSVFLAIKHASAAMQVTSKDKPASGGSIVATASVAGLRSGAGGMDYSASKAAVISLMQTSCMQLYGTNVRVNAICPGLIETAMTKPLFDMARAANKVERVGQLNPLKRHGEAHEIASVVAFLASDMASYVNGQAIPVCGGYSASHPFAPGRVTGI
jgi:NAD(P)-dependent dehydrogenase (short-subunit alcohol dehydrogenase family)